MLISNATMHGLGDIAAREEQLEAIFAPASAWGRPDTIAVNPPADAYFVTSGASGTHAYTGTGSFTFSNGTLTDAGGNAVLGYRSASSPLAPLCADPVDAALGRMLNARIDADGSVRYERMAVDPRTGRREAQDVTIGRLALARFPAGTKVPPPRDVIPHTGTAADGNFGAVSPFVPGTNASDIDAGLARLQEAYLALDAVRAAGKAEGSVQKTAMDLLK